MKLKKSKIMKKKKENKKENKKVVEKVCYKDFTVICPYFNGCYSECGLCSVKHMSI